MSRFKRGYRAVWPLPVSSSSACLATPVPYTGRIASEPLGAFDCHDPRCARCRHRPSCQHQFCSLEMTPQPKPVPSTTRLTPTSIARWPQGRKSESNFDRSPPIHWFRPHIRGGRRLSLVLPWFEADNRCGFRGTVRVPMLVRILRTYKLPEILMLAAATLCVVVSVAAY